MKKLCCLLLALIVCLGTTPALATLVVEFVPAGPVVLAPGIGTTNTTFDIRLSNPTGPAEDIAGYSFFLDVGPLGAALPLGITFDTPAATYVSGAGTPPLIGAGNPGTINLSPAAGDLGLGQVQGFNSTINTGEVFTLLTVALVVDRAVASPGTVDLALNPAGENTIDRLGLAGAEAVSFNANVSGQLTLVAIPEPSAMMALATLTVACCARRRPRSNQRYDGDTRQKRDQHGTNHHPSPAIRRA